MGAKKPHGTHAGEACGRVTHAPAPTRAVRADGV